MSKAKTTKPRKYKSPKAIIKHALALIESRKGWMQGDFHEGDRYCAIGAIEAVSADKKAQRLAECIVAKGVAEATRGLTLDAEDDPREAIINVNDGDHHKRAAGSHRAIVRGFKKALA